MALGILRWSWLLLLCGSLAGCRGESAQQMLETAKFEEVQRNFDHARQLYERVEKEFPNSPEAAVARERRQSMEP